MSMFVQTDKHVIDVSKITHIRINEKSTTTVFFRGEGSLRLDRPEAELLMEGIRMLSEKKLLAAYRATLPAPPR
jgi:hypothetical protein